MSNSKMKRRQRAINRKEKRQQNAIDAIAENPDADSAFDALSDKQAQAVLEVLSEEVVDKESDEKMDHLETWAVPSPMLFGGSQSWSDLDEFVEAEDTADAVRETEREFRTMVNNVLNDETIELDEKSKLIAALAEGFPARVDENKAEKEDPSIADRILAKVGIKAITKREAGANFSASDFADVPDKSKPSTWKLRLAEGRSGNFTVAQVARAITALQPSGFRGQRVKIGSSKAIVIRKISGAINKTGGTDTQKRSLRERLARVKSTGFQVFKDLQGNFRWFGWVSNKWRDRDVVAHPKGEIISEAAHKEYIEWVWADPKNRMPELWQWHTIGTAAKNRADFIDYADGFLVVSGSLDEEEGTARMKLAEEYDIAMSHGFLKNPERYDKENGIINQYRTFEASDLPREFVANEWTDFETLMEVKDMGFTPEKRKYLVATLGEDKVAELEDSTKERHDRLMELKVQFKSDESEVKEVEQEKTEETPAEEAPVTVTNVLNVGKEFGVSELSDYLESQATTLKDQGETLTTLAELVVNLAKSDDEKIAEALSPQMDVEKDIQPVWLRKLSTSKETLLTKEEEGKLDKANEDGNTWVSDAMGSVAVPNSAVPK